MSDFIKLVIVRSRSTYIFRLVSGLVLSLFILTANSQPIINGDKVDRIKLHEVAEIFTSKNSTVEITEVINSDIKWTSLPKVGFAKPSSDDSYWIKFKLFTKDQNRFILELNEVTLDEIVLWQESGTGFQTLGRINKSEEFNLRNSTFRIPTIEFELRKNDTTTLYLFVDDLQGAIACPLTLYNPQSYSSYNRISENVLGIQFGIFLCLLILTVVTWAFFKDFLYLIYGVHLLGAILFQLHESGLFVKYFWSFDQDITKYTRYFSSILSTISLGLIVKYFINTKEILPKLDKILIGFIVFIISAYFVISFLLLGSGLDISFLINLVILVVILYPIFIVVVCLAAYNKTKSLNSLYLIPLFALSILHTILHPLLSYGFIDVSVKNYLSWLGPVEGFLLFGVLIKDFYESKELKIKYQEELIKERAENVNQFLSGQESERKRISQALHDGVNSRLASLKVLVSNSDSSQKNIIVRDLDSIGFDVRSISHALNPHTLRFHGLRGAIEEEIFKIESNNVNIQFTFEYDENVDKLDKGYIEILYYTSLELLQNTLKHSSASEVKIAINCYGNNVFLEFYDNGENIKTEKLNYGLGMKNIESNAKLYNGSFEIESKNGHNLQKLTLLRS